MWPRNDLVVSLLKVYQRLPAFKKTSKIFKKRFGSFPVPLTFALPNGKMVTHRVLRSSLVIVLKLRRQGHGNRIPCILQEVFERPQVLWNIGNNSTVRFLNRNTGKWAWLKKQTITDIFIFREKVRLSGVRQNIYNGEFDPGSGWTLAAGLIHASRGAAG